LLVRLRMSTPVPASASVGYAHHLPGAEIGHTVAAADAALYTAKDRGRDTVAGPDDVVLHR
jgi:PleD family two-component response regulator